MSDKQHNPRLNTVGGQAVLEGVMMKAGTQVSTACRLEDGSITVISDTFVSVRKKHRILNIPLLRGVINFVEMMKLSMRTLNASAAAMGLEEAEESRFSKFLKKHLGIRLTDVMLVLATVLGLALALVLFLYLPRLASTGIQYLAGDRELGIWKAVAEGIVKIIIFILYLLLISLMPDIRRTFQYHGAEHKSIACYEAGLPLTPAQASKCSRFHPRCGTSFMFFMILLGVIVGIFVNLIFPDLPDLAYVGIRILILPLVVGIGYEFIMFAGKHPNLVTKILSAPGLWMQCITTRPPDESQLEVAIVALKHALGTSVFPDFDPTQYEKKPAGAQASSDDRQADPDAQQSDAGTPQPDTSAQQPGSAAPQAGEMTAQTPASGSTPADAPSDTTHETQ